LSNPSDAPGRVMAHALARAVALLILWLVLAGSDLADLPAGIVAVLAATLTSLRLLPVGPARPSPVLLGPLALRFLYQSVIAGMDVAWRALDPRLPLRPGFVVYSVGFPLGSARNAFAALTSLLPGTVPSGDEGSRLIYHCLDVDQPVVSQLAAEEAALRHAIRHD
jgi:multicomponent Na+:H+ antiporter subunit E